MAAMQNLYTKEKVQIITCNNLLTKLVVYCLNIGLSSMRSRTAPSKFAANKKFVNGLKVFGEKKNDHRLERRRTMHVYKACLILSASSVTAKKKFKI